MLKPLVSKILLGDILQGLSAVIVLAILLVLRPVVKRTAGIEHFPGVDAADVEDPSEVEAAVDEGC